MQPAAQPAAPATQPASQPQRSTPTPIRRQYVSFAFYKLLPEFRRLPQDQQKAMLSQFADLIETTAAPSPSPPPPPQPPANRK